MIYGIFPAFAATTKNGGQWHPCQHPEGLLERIIKLSCVPGDFVIDAFAGTGTCNRVCKKLAVHCIGVEISKTYCKKIEAEAEERKK
jgi:DNA modification methylase